MKLINLIGSEDSVTCSSVRPTCPIGGWENTAEGTALNKGKKIIQSGDHY